jgi:voltage-gated potassium channel
MGDQGVELNIRKDETEHINKRAISDGSSEMSKKMLVSKNRPLDLLFFRMIFQHMIQEGEGNGKAEGADEDQDGIPVAAFQRTLERLFYVLRDDRGFDAREYDVDGNGCVGWSEFVHVFRQRKIVINLSLMERIYITLSDPESCFLAQIISVLVLLVIGTSSICFMMGTMYMFQKEEGDLEPKPLDVFKSIEWVCLAIFIVEYLSRLLTCWMVREEVIDQKQLMSLTVGYEAIFLPSPPKRLLSFVFEPANFIDLAAILPGVISLLEESVTGRPSQIKGGGFVVLRLIRLTRVFRAPAIREPAFVIAVTLRRSTKALYVLAFNLGLGIVISGSLMYLVEGGDWNAETQTYDRIVSYHVWDNATGTYIDERAISPFVSIPHSFWWAIVTATTVGYGDHFPTTPLGYTIATAFMIFSLVMMALPIGVIGGTFATVWEEVQETRERSKAERKGQGGIIKASFQRFEPFATMSKLMLIDVWNERFPIAESGGVLDPNSSTRPLKGDFMGQVRLELNLSQERAASEELTLPLQSDYETVTRDVTGQLTVRYEWTPEEPPKERGDLQESEGPLLVGTLKMTISSASNLLNLNLGKPSNCFSNPYCMVLCYPKSASVCGDLVQPCIWRTPSVDNNLHPEFNFSHDFHFAWFGDSDGRRVKPRVSSANVKTAQKE